jgi:hypothetical protein
MYYLLKCILYMIYFKRFMSDDRLLLFFVLRVILGTPIFCLLIIMYLCFKFK